MKRTLFSLGLLCLLAACSYDNPPYEDISGTRWIGTNYAQGNLVDLTIDSGDSRSATLLFYSDPRTWEERSGGIDTAGRLLFTLKGTWSPVSESSVQYGFSWIISWMDENRQKYEGRMEWDNHKMFIGLNGSFFPAYQVE